MNKYNDILLHSMRLAIAEDFVNLIILNRDDTEFELKDLLEKKEEYYPLLLKEFLRLNSSPVAAALKTMEDPIGPQFRKTKKTTSKNAKNQTKPGTR